MFYAPWSAESQHARAAYEFVARTFSHEATFSAINCWQPGGECKQQYAKVMSWPVLMAYTQNNIAVPYNGKWNKAALTRFVLSMIRPLQRITEPEELLKLIHNHDAVAVAFVNMQASNSFYNIFLQTAMKWLERDPHRDVAFAVVTGESMEGFDVYREPTLRLYLWNDTIEYDHNVWKPSKLMKWMEIHLRKVSHWISTSGAKSTEFKPFLDKGPVLLLFTPRNLHDALNDAYSMVSESSRQPLKSKFTETIFQLRQVGYEYFNCDHDGWLMEMARIYIHNQREKNHIAFQEEKIKCDQFFDWKKSRRFSFNRCPSLSSRSFGSLVNSSKFHAKPGKAALNRPNDVCAVDNAHESNAKCVDRPAASSFISSMKSHCKHTEQIQPATSMLNTEEDSRSADKIASVYKTLSCEITNLSEAVRPKMFYEEGESSLSTNASSIDFDKINGLACKTNRTLSLMAMDSFTYELMAERLGIELKDSDHNTAVAIIDNEVSLFLRRMYSEL